MPEIVEHRTINGKFRITIERAASSTRQIDGFKVEANGDVIEAVEHDIQRLYNYAQQITITLKENQ